MTKRYLTFVPIILLASFFLSLPSAYSGAGAPSAADYTASVLKGQPTSITSRIEGIISNGHQEHLWVTSDGGIHALVAGSELSTNGLRLFSSYDEGASWTQTITVSETAVRPKADGFLRDDQLYVLYTAPDGELVLTCFSHDPATGQWQAQGSYRVYEALESVALERVTATQDIDNRTWIALTEVNELTEESIIKVAYADESLATTHLLGSLGTPNTGLRKSARILALGDGVVVVYTDQPSSSSTAYTLNWAYRLNSSPSDTWVEAPLFHYSEADGESDRYGVHFSAVVDNLGGIHIVSRSEGELVYFRVFDYQLVEPSPKRLAAANPYAQVAVADDATIYISYAHNFPPYSDIVWVLKSLDHGDTFDLKDVLIWRPRQNLGKARLEIPAHVGSFLPVLRQIEHANGLSGLVFFNLSTEIP